MKEIRNWFVHEPKKALCILGTRQTGKTTLVRVFAQEMNLTLVEINFMSDPAAARIFADSPDPRQIMLQLSYRSPQGALDSQKYHRSSC